MLALRSIFHMLEQEKKGKIPVDLETIPHRDEFEDLGIKKKSLIT